MNTPKTARFELHVPAILPGGTPTPESELKSIEKLIMAVSGGFTRHDGRGHWDDEEGVTHIEPVIVYTFDVADGYEQGPNVRSIAHTVAVRLKRKAVYLTWSAVTGEMVEA